MKKILTLIAVFGLVAGAQAQYLSDTIRSSVGLTNIAFTTLNTNETHLVVGAKPIQLTKDLDIDIITTMVATNTAGTNVIMLFKTSQDGVNLDTTPTISVTNSLNSTTTVRSRKNIPATSLLNARYLVLYSVQNGHTNAITVSKIEYGAWK